jgi:alpha-1,3-mannosyltransferase
LGLPEYREAFPAFCCWNGLAVLRAEPFYRGLRFRSTRPGQGVLSECTNLCLDLWANGYSRVVVDPQASGVLEWEGVGSLLVCWLGLKIQK